MCVCVSASTHNVDVVLEQWSSSESGREEYEERPDDGGVRTATLCGRCDKTSLLQRPHYTIMTVYTLYTLLHAGGGCVQDLVL